MKSLLAKFRWLSAALLCAVMWFAYVQWQQYRDLNFIIENLKAESRIAQVLVTEARLDEATGDILTTIKFLEFDVAGKPLKPLYFTFRGNVIQFQSLVIRFDDELVEAGDPLKGKSVYLFLKAFALNGANTQEFVITPAESIPRGYRLAKGLRAERQLWSRFWEYALNEEARKSANVKNAQLEAPGTAFIPGSVYEIKIEHDGGMRIDAKPIPEVLRGEKI